MTQFLQPYQMMPSIFNNIVAEPNMGTIYEIENINRAIKASKEFLKNAEEEQNLKNLKNTVNWLSGFNPEPLELTQPNVDIDFDKLDSNLRDACFDISKMINWKPEAVLFALLGYINAAMRGRYKITITDQWIEKSPLFIMLVGGPGTIKSGLHEMLVTPFTEIQNEIDTKYHSIQQGLKYKNRLIESGRRELAKDYGKDISNYVRAHEDDFDIEFIKHIATIYQLANEKIDREIIEANNFIRYLVSDIATDIHLLKRMRDSGGGQAIISAEAKTFVERIKKKMIDIRIFNNSYDLESYGYGSERNSVPVSNAFLNILFFSQPKVTLDFLKNEDVIGTGLGSRFITVFIEKNNDSISDIDCGCSSVRKFNDIIRSMIQKNIQLSMKGKFKNLILDKYCYTSFTSYRNEIENLKTTEKSDIILQTLNRMPGLIIRLATTLNAFSVFSGYETYLEERNLQLGNELAHYALNDKDWISNPEGLSAIQDAQLILKWASDNNCAFFDSRHLAQYSPVRKIDRIFPALDLLERNKYLAQIKTGRSPRICGLNPRLL